jgi:hypothetical protein
MDMLGTLRRTRIGVGITAAILFAIIAASNLSATFSHSPGFLGRAEPIVVVAAVILLVASVISIPFLRAPGGARGDGTAGEGDVE